MPTCLFTFGIMCSSLLPFLSIVYQHESSIMRLTWSVFFGAKPDYTMLKSFGCACWPHFCPYNSRKLAFRSKECIFVGNSLHHKGYKCLDASTGRIYISRDMVFVEAVFPFARKLEATLAPANSSAQSYIHLLPPTSSPSTHVPTPSRSTSSSNDWMADEQSVSFDAHADSVVDSELTASSPLGSAAYNSETSGLTPGSNSSNPRAQVLTPPLTS